MAAPGLPPVLGLLALEAGSPLTAQSLPPALGLLALQAGSPLCGPPVAAQSWPPLPGLLALFFAFASSEFASRISVFGIWNSFKLNWRHGSDPIRAKLVVCNALIRPKL